MKRGTELSLRHHVWHPDTDPDDRDVRNAIVRALPCRVLGYEWLPPSQRMVVRLNSALGEFCLTPHELELNT